MQQSRRRQLPLSACVFFPLAFSKKPLRRMDDEGKAAARASIETLRASGSTNLSDGILSAVSPAPTL